MSGLIIPGVSGHEKELAGVVVEVISDYVRDNENVLDPLVPDKRGRMKWQPSDFKFDIDDNEKLREFRDKIAPNIPLETRIALAGNILTEEGLPGYMYTIMRFQYFQEQPILAGWARRWIAEEKKHGKLLSHWANITNLYDMSQLERVEEAYNIQEIDLGIPLAHQDSDETSKRFLLDLASAFAYVSFQEKSTHTSHNNAKKKLMEAGDEWGAEICGIVAGDEARHHKLYQSIFHEILKASPDYALVALEGMVKKGFRMPSANSLSEHEYKVFNACAEESGVFGIKEYAGAIETIIGKRWGDTITNLTGLTPEASSAQDYLGVWVEKEKPRIINIGEKRHNRGGNQELLRDLSKHPWLKQAA